ncbi:MAG: tyrosine--tRNA ligase [Myxococcaceae bacterium]|nr:tyrosine--tRNA ligase [Myxococcaceae bacterium]
MLHDAMPGTEELLSKSPGVKGYIGFDPTADSLGVGHLVQVMTLLHFQRAGHHPIALVGGATGLVGDPSGKSSERNLLTEEVLEHNLAGIKAQLERFLDFGGGRATLVNNADWFRGMTFLEFIRDIGKHLTVNYMLAKDSVKKRIEGDGEGMSFTEFSYQLVQGHDFFHLWKTQGVQLQMGGSDQWGNIVTGTELIRRRAQGQAWALTTNLITKADGTKFGKTESGNVWLDPKRTSPYEFYQFWLNASDADAASWVRIFTLRGKDELDALEATHAKDPSARHLQRTLAADVTERVHSRADVDFAIKAADVLFGKATVETLKSLSEQQIASIFKDVPQKELSRDELVKGIPFVELVTTKTGFVESKGAARKLMEQNGLALNKEKVTEPTKLVDASALLSDRYLLLSRGKKDNCLVRVG